MNKWWYLKIRKPRTSTELGFWSQTREKLAEKSRSIGSRHVVHFKEVSGNGKRR